MSDKDYWKKVYEQAEPKAAKYLHSNGTIDENPGTGGGGGITVEALSVTENGVYTAPSGKAYSPVTVNIPSSAGKRTIGVQGAMGDSDGYIDVKGFDSASNMLSNLPAGTYHFHFFSTDTSGTINTVTTIFADTFKVSVSNDVLTASEDVAFLNQDDTYSAVGYYSAIFQSTN